MHFPLTDIIEGAEVWKYTAPLNFALPKMNNIRYRLLKGTIDLPRGNLAVPFHSRKKHDF